MKKFVVFIVLITMFTSTGVKAAEVSRESAPCNAKPEAIIVVESFIGDILTEVQNGLGYSDARAKSNRIFFDAFLKGETNGYTTMLTTFPNMQYLLCSMLVVVD